MSDPYCVIISGPSGSGKSTTARALWHSLESAAYLNLDSVKHIIYDAPSDDHHLDLARENGLLLAQSFLNAGHPVIVDKAFGDYDYVRPFVDLSSGNGFSSFYFKLWAPLDSLVERVDQRRVLPPEGIIAQGEWPPPRGNEESATRIFRFFEKHKHEEGIEIDTSSISSEEVVEKIRSYLP